MDDLISRQAAIKLLKEWADGYPYLEVPVSSIEHKLNELPSAEKRGEWIIQSDTYHEYWECDQCGMGVGLDDVRNYCPNCGARMEE